MPVSRRAALAAGGLALTTLAGCLGVLGAQPREDAAEQTPRFGSHDAARTAPAAHSTSTSGVEPTTTASTEQSEGAPETESHVQPQTERHAPGDAPLHSGPVDSAPTNDWLQAVADPAPGVKLENVTLEMGPISAYVRDPMYLSFTDDLQLSIAPSGDSFTAVGRFHLRTTCDGYGIDRVYVTGREGYIVLTYGERVACNAAHEGVGVGPWFAEFTVTGSLVGEFETLRIQLREGHVNYPGMPAIVEVEQPVP